jgi:hypothetical protein
VQWAASQPNAPQQCATSTASQPVSATLSVYTWLESACSQTLPYICRLVGEAPSVDALGWRADLRR